MEIGTEQPAITIEPVELPIPEQPAAPDEPETPEVPVEAPEENPELVPA